MAGASQSERVKSWLARSVSAALVIIPACGVVDEQCRVQSRSLEYGAETRTASAVGNGFLELSETRGAESGAWVIWHVRMAPQAAPARLVSLREGPPEAPGRVLYEFPLVNSVAASGVVTQVFVRTPYAGTAPFPELWDLIQRQPVSFEIAFDGAPAMRIGPLLRTGSSDWQDACS